MKIRLLTTLLIALMAVATGYADRLTGNVTRRYSTDQQRVADTDFPVTGSPHVAVILAEFQDTKFREDNLNNYYTRMLNQEDFEAWGSAADWLSDNSMGIYRPVFDVYGPVTLPHPSDYYGGNTVFGEDRRPLEMIADACAAADSLIDFSNYDINGDAKADYIFVYYAGRGESSGGSASTLWPHHGSMEENGKGIEMDGVRIDKYGCTNEMLKNEPAGIGTFLHQFLIFLGVPSLESGNPDTHFSTPGAWSIMDTGCHNKDTKSPPSLSAFERMTLGWLQPRDIAGTGNYTLVALAESNDAIRIRCGNSENEYFLLEYRSLEGWDMSLPNHGLLVWHIDVGAEDLKSGYVNSIPEHQRVRLIKPNRIEMVNSLDENYTDILAGWCLPGVTGMTELTDFTTPSLTPWSGERLYFPLYNIREDWINNSMNFTLGDDELLPAPQVYDPIPEEIGYRDFTLHWTPVEGAENYIISIYPEQSGKTMYRSCDFGQSLRAALPADWYAIGTASYTATANCGRNAPALRFKDEGAQLTTEWFEEPITYLSFWHNGVTPNGSSLVLNGLDSNHSSHYIREFILPEQGKTIRMEKDEFPEDIHCLQWIFHRTSGSAAMDDIIIQTGDYVDPIEGFEFIETGNVDSFTVTDLPDDYEICRATVRSVIGDAVSIESESITVHLDKTKPDFTNSIREGHLADIRIEGMTIASEDEIIVFRPDGTSAGSGRNITVPGCGIYIVATKSGRMKVII